MTQLAQQFLSPLEFRFTLSRLPKTNFFVQQVVLPSIELSFITQPTPFLHVSRTGNTMTYGELQVTFKVDEDFNNYRELYDWMVGLGFPRKFDEYRKINSSDDGLYSDGSVIIMSSQKNPSVIYNFTNMFPISLSALQLDTTQIDVAYVDCTVTFKYDTFTISRLRDD